MSLNSDRWSKVELFDTSNASLEALDRHAISGFRHVSLTVVTALLVHSARAAIESKTNGVIGLQASPGQGSSSRAKEVQVQNGSAKVELVQHLFYLAFFWFLEALCLMNRSNLRRMPRLWKPTKGPIESVEREKSLFARPRA